MLSSAVPSAREESCPTVQGRGCRSSVPAPGARPCPREAGGGDSSDTADTAGGFVEGQGLFGECGCATAGAPSFLAFLLAFVAVRRLWLLVLLIAIVAPARAGVDAQHLQTLDGGTFPALKEAEAGLAWGLAGSASLSGATGLVIQTDVGGRRRRLLQEVWTQELGGSVRLGDAARVGVSAPIHRWIRYANEPIEQVWGDVSVWGQVPILAKRGAPHLSFYMQIEAPTGTPELYLGDPRGAIRAEVALGFERAGWHLLSNGGVRLAEPTYIPGSAWGTRFAWGLGVQRAFVRRMCASLELFGSGALSPPTDAAGAFPVEFLATVGVDVTRGFVARVGGGAGLTNGVGSPAGRLLLMVDARRRDYADQDGDGIIDPRDDCISVPEDPDGVEDADGCPEDDADADGLLDTVDLCPTRPETRNGFRDTDGCPDRLTELTLTVLTDDDDVALETVEVTIGGLPPFRILPEEETLLALEPGVVELRVEAPEFAASEEFLTLEPGKARHQVNLRALRYGDVTLRLRDPVGAPLDGFLRGRAGLELVPAAGRSLTLPTGPTPLAVHAPGFSPRTVEIDVTAKAQLEVVVSLEPSALRIEGSRIESVQEVHFPLDSAILDPDDLGPLHELAALLLADPRIELLRIEGHADESGTSRYNLDLSRRRAEAIEEWLVRAGVPSERLEAVGTGEARPREDGRRSRRVEFLVLVWADERVSPRPD